MTKSFSCLTVSKRTGWEEIYADSINRQTVKADQTIIITEEFYKTALALTKDFPSRNEKTSIIDHAPKKTRLSNLNASLNKGLGLVTSDYVIFYQDFIELKEDCFEKLLALATPRTFVTTCTPNYDGSDDGRYTGVDVPRPCIPEEWEANVALAPMDFIRELGGFDERLDDGWSWDNALLARKAAMLGAKFILDESNRPKLYPHEMSSHNTLPKNGELVEKIMYNIRNGIEPLNCGCL